MSVQTVEPLELQELEQRIIDGHAAVLQAAASALVKAITVGENLLRVRELVPPGEWDKWKDQRIPFSATTARTYMRLAYYQREIGTGPLTLNEARDRLRKYPALPLPHQHDEAVRAHAKKLYRTGLTPTAIARRLGVSRPTVQRWVNPSLRKREEKASERRREAAKRALRREESLTLARKRGDALGRAYVAIRLAARELDACRGELGQYRRQQAARAHTELDAAEESAAEALRRVYRAEDIATRLVRRSSE